MRQQSFGEEWVLKNSQPKHTHVFSASGRAVVCCYSDCAKPGFDDIRIVKPSMQHKDSTATYIFCSENHKNDYMYESEGIY